MHSIVSNLEITIKSHKPDGEVKPRPIHASSLHPLKAGMLYAVSVLDGLIRQCSHMVKDTDDVEQDFET